MDEENKKIEKILEKNVEDLTDEEFELLEDRLGELGEEIENTERKMNVCAYGKKELYEFMALQNQYNEIYEKIYGEE